MSDKYPNIDQLPEPEQRLVREELAEQSKGKTLSRKDEQAVDKFLEKVRVRMTRWRGMRM